MSRRLTSIIVAALVVISMAGTGAAAGTSGEVVGTLAGAAAGADNPAFWGMGGCAVGGIAGGLVGAGVGFFGANPVTVAGGFLAGVKYGCTAGS